MSVRNGTISPEEKRVFSLLLSKLNFRNPNSIRDARKVLIPFKPTTAVGSSIVRNLQGILTPTEEPEGNAVNGGSAGKAAGAILGALIGFGAGGLPGAAVGNSW
ncbi:hypothetical protein AHMF7605_21855 [Adhaeribacter arboris]|uniref:Uncharacterized protein n=2 Tax=Adhaeribacter arboris TaxID=2072846 RepID=A0A2T2YKB6_9BACT|nr:hypothetical protein AHMF7605_21855 [Adhaeribacter arboris]